MDIKFPNSQQRDRRVLDVINYLRNIGQIERTNGQAINFLYVQPKFISYEFFREFLDLGVQFDGYLVYLRMAQTTYDTVDVTAGVRGATREEENPTPPPPTVTVNQKWDEWGKVVQTKNDNSEVIVSVPYQPTSDELNAFEEDANVLEIFGSGLLLDGYKNSVDWVKDETGTPVTEPPVDKDPVYYTLNWSSDGEVFDFLHAQRLVIQWYTDALAASGLGNQAFWDSLSDEVKTEAIRWGVLPNNNFGENNISAHVPNRRDRGALRKWHVDKLRVARERRFNDGYAFLRDNFREAALEGYVNDYFIPAYREQYIYLGDSSAANGLLVNGVLNAAWTSQWQSADVLYDSEVTTGQIQNVLERILDGDRY